MEKPINYYFEDTPENREAANKALEEHLRVFKNTPFYYVRSKESKEKE